MVWIQPKKGGSKQGEGENQLKKCVAGRLWGGNWVWLLPGRSKRRASKGVSHGGRKAYLVEVVLCSVEDQADQSEMAWAMPTLQRGGAEDGLEGRERPDQAKKTCSEKRRDEVGV